MKLTCGVGINDADYVIQKTRYIEGGRTKSGLKRRELIWSCPYHHKWSDMLRRCYSKSELIRKPSYNGCSVCEEWLTFSNFKKWMEQQDWEGKQLDKDILVEDNKLYSPETCVFVSQQVNAFLTDRKAKRGDCLLGVHIVKGTGKYRASVNNIFTGKLERLGCFDEEMEAHLTWKSRKHELACMLANSKYVDDERVANALKSRYN